MGGKMAKNIDIFQAVGINNPTAYIDWDLTPADTFGTFESWGGRERIRNNHEKFYYFYIDGWQNPPQVCLMERAVKHAKVLARIDAPRELVAAAIKAQGKLITLDRSYAIDTSLRHWLTQTLIDHFDDSLITPLKYEDRKLEKATGLPTAVTTMAYRPLPPLALRLTEQEMLQYITSHNLYDTVLNPTGETRGNLIDNQDGLTVTDAGAGIMWQRQGYERINTFRHIQKYIQRMNDDRYNGYDDWRLPTVSEALCLLQKEKNVHGMHIHPCFSPDQSFIFTQQLRQPGGHWFIDLIKGSTFWASGSNPGGYGCLCRSL